MDILVKKYHLTAQTCDQVADLIMEQCARMKTDRKDALIFRLTAEDCLAYWLAHGGEEKTVTLCMGWRMLTPVFTLDLEGPECNPYQESMEEVGAFAQSLLVNLRLNPEFSYLKGHNRLLFRMRKKAMGQLAHLGVAASAGLLAGLLGFLLPESLRMTLLEGLVTPLYSTFFRMLGCVAGLMVFLSVAWGIYGIGDAETFNRIGKKLLLSFLLAVFLVTAAGTVFFQVLGPGISVSSAGENRLAQISQTILSVFPKDVMSPFAAGNTLQIIVMAAAAGAILLYLGARTTALARVVGEANALVHHLMRLVSQLIPWAVSLVIITFLWKNQVSRIASAGRFLLVYAGAMALAGVAFVTLTALRQRVSPVLLAQKALPAGLLALTTASSAAAFSTNVKTLEKDYGINSSLVSFGLPLGIVMHDPTLSLSYLLIRFHVAKVYSVACSPAWIVMAVVLCAMLAVATPPIPGGAAAIYSMLFAQMGIPSEARALILSLDVLIDFLLTALQSLTLQMTMINVSAELGMIDKSVLKAPKRE